MDILSRIKLGWDVIRGKQLPAPHPLVYGMEGYQGTWGLRDKQGDVAAMLDSYHSWVYACVHLRSQNVARATFRLYAQRGNQEPREIEEHPFLDMLWKVNPFETQYNFLFRTQANLDLTGNAYWYVAKNQLGVPAELWLLPTDKVTIVPSRSDVISHYELSNYKDTVNFDPEEIIHLKYPNPADFFYGASPLMAAMYAADINEFQHQYQRNMYKNNAVPPFALKTDQKLDERSFQRLRDGWHRRYGGADGDKLAVLEAGLSIEKIGVSPSELDWMQTNRVTRDEIFAIYGIPASKLGLVEDVNRANAEANDYTFSANVLEPILTMYDETMTENIVGLYDESLYVVHDSTIRTDERDKAEISRIRVEAGLTTPNEERELLGFDPIEGGDELRKEKPKNEPNE